jgi:hypothetical protein
VFGCRAFTLDHHNNQSKLHSQAHATTYLGPASKHDHTHQLLLDNTKKVIITHDVIFQESIMPIRAEQCVASSLSTDAELTDQSSPAKSGQMAQLQNHSPLQPSHQLGQMCSSSHAI